MARHALRHTEGYKFVYHFTNLYDDYVNKSAMEALLNDDYTLKPEVQNLLNIPIGYGTRLLVERKYNISISMQLRMEQYFDQSQHWESFSFPELVETAHPHQTHYYDNYVQTTDVFDDAHNHPVCNYF